MNWLTEGSMIPFASSIVHRMLALSSQDPTLETSAFYQAMQDVLSFEIGSVPSLAPENWLIAMPRLDITVRLTSRNCLVVEVSPPTEAALTARRENGKLTALDDFREFALEKKGGLSATIRVFEYELEMAAQHGFSGPRDADSSKSAILFRECLQAMVEVLIQSLALHFDCRLRSMLVCHGEQKLLSVRELVFDRDTAERANLLEDQSALKWHPQLEEITLRTGLSFSELYEFYQRQVRPLEKSLQLRTLADFAGLSVYRGMTAAEEVLKVLTITADPKTYPPLVVGNAIAVAEVRRLCKRANDWWRPLAERYAVTKQQAKSIIRQLCPDVLQTAVLFGPDLVEELQYALDHKDSNERVDLFREKLCSSIEQAWQAGRGTISRKKSTARSVGFSSYEELMDWTRVRAPEVHQMLEELAGKLPPARNT